MSKLSLRAVLFLLAATALRSPFACAQLTAPIRLTVDATQASRKLLHTQMIIPVKPGPLTLFYPKWIQGEHDPHGPITNLTGLKLSANEKPVPWSRDTFDVFTFHVNVPSDAKELVVSFDYLEPSGVAGGSSSTATDKLLDFNWYPIVLYPAGFPASKIMLQATLQLPAGWKFGCALPIQSQSSSEILFQTVPLDRLLDSPVIAGEYYRVFDLTP